MLRVSCTMPGLTEMELMPQDTNFRVTSEYTEGAWPQIETLTPRAAHTLIVSARTRSTAGLRSSKMEASRSLSRSTPRTNWVRSLLPMDTPSIPTSRNWSKSKTLEVRAGSKTPNFQHSLDSKQLLYGPDERHHHP